MDGSRFSIIVGLYLCALAAPAATHPKLSDENPLNLPGPAANGMRILAPTTLELTYISTKQKGKAMTPDLGMLTASSRLPKPQDFKVLAGQDEVPVTKVGFKRRVLYAPLKQWDLRVANYLYLELGRPLADGQRVEIKNPGNHLWPSGLTFDCTMDPYRYSPVLHANQTGYVPALPKKAMVGYYLGSLGEMDLQQGLSSGTNGNHPAAGPLQFKIVDAHSRTEVYRGQLKPRRDQGFAFDCYQKVLEADFSDFKTPGDYCLWIPGVGTSFEFEIDEGVAGAFARTYALGIYHQRCGAANELPYTRFTHGPCHSAPAEVPNGSQKFEFVNQCLAKMTEGCKENPRHTAPQMKNVDACLYPFVNRGPIDIRGGHHDAGDYSKYTINSAAFIHHLVFAADVFPGAGSLDNLGLPESGDGKSDLLEEAKWEADFLAKMQDADGGFYFLVYPRGREYETDVLPDHGDPQVVFPKTTSVTAAATAALAECASSPKFKQQFPEAAARYLAAAWKGWGFLQHAIDKFGKDGSYQKITHYGDEFMHDDELAWAACELFLASGDPSCHKKAIEWLKPSDPGTRRWGWWRLYDAYGCAIRSYAFAAKTGRLKPDQLNQFLAEECQNEIAAAGEDQLHRAQSCAYGTSFPEEAKRARNAGWYFSSDAAFDLAVACQLDYPANRDPRQQMMEALVSNLNYEQGCNPVNVTYLTGLGWHRQREIVDQYALNDRRVLPPTGIPLGSIQAGFGWNYVYENELGTLSFPSDGSETSPYPFYDRWGDAFNLTQEFVSVNQARALGYLAWMMAQTSLKGQSWKSAPCQIIEVDSKAQSKARAFRAESQGTDLSRARIIWEADGQEPRVGSSLDWAQTDGACHWLEVEIQLPDGRRLSGSRELNGSTPPK